MILGKLNKNTNPNSVSKQDLRIKMRSLLEGTLSGSVTSKLDKEKAIAKNLLTVLPTEGCVATFNSIQLEPNVNGLIGEGALKFAYPVVEGSILHFYQPLNLGDFSQNSFGILEPVPERSRLIGPDKIAAMLIPGVAFDRQLRRLGRGRGYYDKYLQGFMGLKIGIAFKCQVMGEDLPEEEHDQKMDLLITEDFILQRFDV